MVIVSHKKRTIFLSVMSILTIMSVIFAICLLSETNDNTSATIVSSGTCGNEITWSLDDNGILTIDGTGPMDDYNTINLPPWYSVRNSILSVSIKSGVTTIGAYSFYNCTNMISISIPSTVTKISSYSIFVCTSLKSLTIPDSVVEIEKTAIANCTSLTSLTIPITLDVSLQSTMPLNSYNTEKAFVNISTLKEITFTRGTNGICYDYYNENGYIPYYEEAYVPYNKTPWYQSKGNLTTVILEEGIVHISGYMFTGETALTNVSLPNTLTSIGYSAFSGTGINEITIPDSVTDLRGSVFSGCKNLTHPKLSNSLTKIPSYTFRGCNSLTAYTIDTNITKLEDGCFYECTSLSSLNFSPNLKEVGQDVFYNCPISNIFVPNTNGYYKVEDGVLYSKDGSSLYLFFNNPLRASFTVPNSVSTIKENAFRNITNLTSIEFNEGLSSIEEEAFSNSGVVDVVLPNSLINIGRSAFSGCSSLRSLTIPTLIFDLPWGIIEGCSALETLTLPISTDASNTTTSMLYQNENLWPSLNSIVFTKGTGVGVDYSGTSINYMGYEKCEYAIWNRSNPTSITFENGITYIGEKMFTRTLSFDVIIPDSVTRIGDYAFYGVTSDTVYFSNNLTAVGEHTFNKTFKDQSSNNINSTIPDNLAGRWFKNYVETSNNITYSLSGAYDFTVGSIAGEIVTLPIIEGYDVIWSNVQCVPIVDNKFTMIDDDITIYGTATARLYPVFVDLDGGSIAVVPDGWELVNGKYTKLMPYGTTTDAIKTLFSSATKTECNLRWFEMSNSVTTDGLRLAANWDVNKYEITWLDYNDNVLAITSVEYGKIPTYPLETPMRSPTVEKEYIFEKWNNEPVEVSGNCSYTAVYIEQTRHYTVKFVIDNIEYIQSCEYQSIPIAPDNPLKMPTNTRTYTFTGWDKSISPVTYNTTYYALFSENVRHYNVKFLSDGEIFHEYQSEYGVFAIAPDAQPTKESDNLYQYVFIGWDGYVSDATVITTDTYFSAVYSSILREYAVQFKVDGRLISSTTMAYGMEISLPDEPTKESDNAYSYTFDRWNGYIEKMTVEGSITFDAIFTPHIREYTVKFINNNEIVENTYSYGETIIAPTNPIKDSDDVYNYNFSHWNGYNQGMKVSGEHIFTAVFDATVKNIAENKIILLTIPEDSGLKLDTETISTIVQNLLTDEESSFSLKVGAATLSFDSNSVQSFEWDGVSASVTDVSETLDKEKKDVVKGRPVYDIKIKNKEGNIHKFINNNSEGILDITVRYDLKDDEDPNQLKVYYLSGNKLSEPRDCKYFEEEGLGYVTFSTTHLSEYAIMYGIQEETTDNNEGNNTVILIYITLACSIAALVVSVINFFRK